LLAVHAAVLLFGLAGLLGKIIVAPPVLIVFSRALLAALALGAAGALTRRRHGDRSGTWPSPGSRTSLVLGVSGLVLALHWLAFFQAIQTSTVAIGLLTYSSFPLFVTFLEPWAFRERLRCCDVLAALAIVAGLLLVAPRCDFHDRLSVGAAWGTLSAFTFAVLNLLNRKLVEKTPPVRIAASQNAVAAVVLLPLLPRSVWSISSRDLALLLALGLLCTAVAHLLYIRSLVRLRAQVASLIAALEPVYGILFAFLILREAPAPRTLLGGMVIIAASLVTTCWRAKRVPA
jgi:drug/metabolite transporter (DMT)-like permease